MCLLYLGRKVDTDLPIFKYHPNCIFCSEPLPLEATGEGEHVIPKSIYGFWKIYDVCPECMKHFGDAVDILAIRNPQIMEALDALHLPEANKFSRDLPYVGQDITDKHDVEMIKRGESFKTKVNVEGDDLFQCSESEWERLGVEWLRKQLGSTLSKPELDAEIFRINEIYYKINPGESVSSPFLGFEIRKRRVTDVRLDNKRLKPISPLIAKIAFCFLSYALSPNQLSTVPYAEVLRAHAMGNGELNPYLGYRIPNPVTQSFEKWHRCRLECFEHFLCVGITLFGNVLWRSILPTKQIILIPNEQGILCDSAMFVLDFEDLSDKQLIMGLRPQNQKKYDYYP